MDSIGVGVAAWEGAGLGEAASPSTTPLTLITALVKSDADGDGVWSAPIGATAGQTPELAVPARAPIRTTARPSASSRKGNLRTGEAPL
jgi:hypothetical protein